MREYEVKIGGIVHTMLLTEESAKRRGAVEHKRAAPAKAAPRTARRRVAKPDADNS